MGDLEEVESDESKEEGGRGKEGVLNGFETSKLTLYLLPPRGVTVQKPLAYRLPSKCVQYDPAGRPLSGPYEISTNPWPNPAISL